MAEQERKQTRRDDSGREVEEDQHAATEVGEELTEKIDDLLDEIDSVLEENAEEFVKNYVQKGGQ
ncbi:MAG: ubiquitin-like protein Pup [Actinomycetota bacterium]|jgi:ubiquitin-like protein Pup|nr:ubiquitin-like protein Pup [Actinomycetota bacterium]